MDMPPPTEPRPPYQGTRAYNLAEKPAKINALILLTLISGLFNIFAAISGTAAVVMGTFGVGLICCAPLTVLPGALGVFEVLYAFDLMAYPAKPVRPNQTIAILEICCLLFGNVLAAIAGVVALVFYSDREVREYFARINRVSL